MNRYIVKVMDMKQKSTVKNRMLALFMATVFVITGFAQQGNTSLKKAFQGDFYIGTALDSVQIIGKAKSSTHLVKHQFNSIVAENCMKIEKIQPVEGKFDMTLPDQFVKFGEKNKMKIIGHNLVWHSQTPDWFFVDKAGKQVSREVLIERMRVHITTLVTRYKGRVHGWDVVNEALEDDGVLRKSLWYKIIGPDYIELAFKFAHEADPKAELYYNDYNLYKPSKRAGAVEIVKTLQAKGCRIDAVGEQGHYSLGMNIFDDLEGSILAFSNLGVKVMITELDLTILPFPSSEITADVSMSYQNSAKYNPYTKEVPQSVLNDFSDYYVNLFKIFVKHKDVIDRVTFWGVNDGQSWRNYWPIKIRTDYPLLFDRENKAKPVVDRIIKESKIPETANKLAELNQ